MTTHNNLNPNSPFFHEERHASLASFVDRPITICGAGALGGNLAETLARMGFTRLKLIDKDRVEMRNLSTQPYSRAEVGAPKARALANMLYRAVQAKLEPIVTELTAANAPKLLKESALIVDAFDNRAGRAAISETARSLHIPCLHIGFSNDGLYGSGLWEPGYQVPQEIAGDPCDYPLTRPFAQVLSALAARSIVDFFRENKSINFELTWNDLKISSD
ncbi:ThiF family adenylyltransferase [Ktedonosporobacter rubrisoli]|uniref:ThiF family adenylyltransferase n=1 Tax=Ktedonosporobacter rubrisoli TaxID=2509675 RepID=A0A4P6K565_KTERU|nr:ThiF family adenylyltransferase [Ktedonosporobacter rubrisoli]QBD82676.1 ThiF family adenylyltransferase [Ktedonosporobacter rubrisoli]